MNTRFKIIEGKISLVWTSTKRSKQAKKRFLSTPTKGKRC